MSVRAAGVEALAEALGRTRRTEPVEPRTGGPAGNARLTAWLGVLLLILFIAELVTLLDVRQLISWHLAIGALLVPPALVKTASTGWRILRYYTGRRPYRVAGPPPMALRILGPLVVVGTLAVLGTGLVLVFVGPDVSRRGLLDVLGQRVDAVSLHQAAFAGWAVVTGLHTLGRLLAAVRLTVAPTGTDEPVPGSHLRGATLGVTALAAAITAALVLSGAGAWRSQPQHPERPPLRHATR